MSVNYSFTYNTAPSSFQTLGNADKSLKNLFDKFDADGSGIIEHGWDNPGGFYNNGVIAGFSGDTYAGSSNNGSYAYSIKADAGSSLVYNFGQHVVSGTIKSITLGGGLDQGNGEVVNELITLNFDNAIVGDIADGRANDVHDIVWGLMNSSTTGADSSSSTSQGGLQAYLASIGIDLDLGSSAGDYLAQDSAGTLPEVAALFGEQVLLVA